MAAVGGTQHIVPAHPTLPSRGPGTIGHVLDERTKAEQKEQDLLSEMKRRLRQMRAVRALHEGAWLINIAFYMGNQWATYNRATRSVYVPPQPPHRVRHVSNVVARHVDRWVAKLTKNRPTMNVEPTTNTDEDKSAARAANAALEHALRVVKFDRKLRAALKTAAVCGAGILRPAWDWKAGEWKTEKRYNLDQQAGTVIDIKTGKRIPVDRFTSDAAETVEQPLGEVVLDYVPPFDFYWDTDAQGPFDCRRVIERSFLPIDEIAAEWGDRGRRVRPQKQDRPEILDYSRRLIADFESKGGWETSGVNESIRDRAAVYRYMEEPSQTFPKGRMVVWADEQILDAGKLPWGLDRIPHTVVPCTTLPWRFWPRSLMDDLRRLQVERNKALSQDIEARNLTRWPKLLVPHGCNLRRDAWNSEAGEKVFYTPIGPYKPEMLTVGSTQHNEGHILRMDSDMRDISAQHEVSHAQVPGGVRSGNAIIALQEADDTVLGPAAAEVEAATEWIGSTLLLLQRENYVERRFLKITGEINSPDVTAMMGSDLKGSIDVRVVPGSSIPQSKYLKEERVLALFKAGLIPDPRRALRLMDRHDALDLYFGEGASRQIARKENLMLARGEHVDVMPEEDAHLHIEEHEQFMRERKFDTRIPPEAWAVMRQHVGDHYESLADKAPLLDLLAKTGMGGGNFRQPGSIASEPGGRSVGAGVPPGRPPGGGGPPGPSIATAGAG